MIFQVRDDILDVIGTEAELGKPAGQDLAEGIYTLPVLLALADPVVGPELRPLLGQPLGQPERDKARSIVAESGAIGQSVVVARRYAELAADAAVTGPTPELADGFAGWPTPWSTTSRRAESPPGPGPGSATVPVARRAHRSRLTAAGPAPRTEADGRADQGLTRSNRPPVRSGLRPPDYEPLGAGTSHLASMAADSLCSRLPKAVLSSRLMRRSIRAARRVLPAAVALASAAVSLGSPDAMRASPLLMRASARPALAQLNRCATTEVDAEVDVGAGAAAPATPAVPRERAPTATAPTNSDLPALVNVMMVSFLVVSVGRSVRRHDTVIVPRRVQPMS